MSEPDQIDMMCEADLRSAFRDIVNQNIKMRNVLESFKKQYRNSPWIARQVNDALDYVEED